MLLKFRSPFIFYCDVPNHDDIKKTYYSRILDGLHENKEETSVEDWNCNVQTSYKFHIPCLIDRYFQNSVVWHAVDNMLNEADLNLYPTTSYIDGIWANYYCKGTFQEVHDHIGYPGKSIFSGIYIIHQEGENRVSFLNNDYWYTTEDLHTSEIPDIKEGTVIIFPSHLLHYVNPVEEPRCTVSFNIRCEF